MGTAWKNNGGAVRAVLCHDIDLTTVLLTGAQFRHGAIAHSLQCFWNGDGVLPRVQHAGDTAHRVGMSLADTPPPEGVILSFGQDHGAVEPHEREQTRGPSAGNQGHMPGFPGGSVHVREVLRDTGVGVKAVHHMEAAGKDRGHLRQVRGAAAAEDEDVDLSGVLVQGVRRVHRRAGQSMDRGGSTPGKHTGQLRIGVLRHGTLHAQGP